MRSYLVALVVALAGCSTYDNAPTASAIISGSYNLRSVDGRPVPFQLVGSTDRIISGRLTIVSSDSLDVSSTEALNGEPPRTFVDRYRYRRTTAGLEIILENLTFIVTGNSREVTLGVLDSPASQQYRYVK